MMRLSVQSLPMLRSPSSLFFVCRRFSSPVLRRCSVSKPSHLGGATPSSSSSVSRSRSKFYGGSSTFVRASHQVSDAGSIDSPMMQAMENKIKEQLQAETVIVKDAYGDGRHVSIYVVSASFDGQSAVNRQRMVYKAISEELQTTVHAVDQMVTKTPAEANKS